MNHYGGGMDIADKEFLYPLPGNKESPLLHHKELGLDHQECHSAIFNPLLVSRSISYKNITVEDWYTAVHVGSSETPEKSNVSYNT